jgi:hypothetical protein
MTERWSGEPTEPVPGYGGYGNQPGAGEPTQMLPPTGRPPSRGGPGGYDDDQQRKRRRNWLIAAGVLAAVIIIVLIILLVTSSGGNSNNAVNISSFNVPSTVNCSGPTTIGVSWSTTNATQVILSIDGSVPFKTYSGPTGADTIPFACNGVNHTYTLTAKSSSGAQATQTQTVTQISTPTTTPRTTPTTKAPTSSSSSSSSSSTSSSTTTST